MFVIQGLAKSTTAEVAKAAFSFFMMMVLFTGLLIAFPQLVLWLPMRGH